MASLLPIRCTPFYMRHKNLEQTFLSVDFQPNAQRAGSR
jgi:hypothetical protein